MSGVQVKKVIAYAVMPGIIPRVRALFSRGFGYIAFLMANVYSMVRLLPPGHPYLEPRNIGKFGIRHVIGEAANNLVVSRKNIDQLLIFALLLGAVVILLLQFGLVLYAVLVRPASALSLFVTPDPTAAPATDIAFMLLDRVFGIPGLFCTTGGVCTAINASLPLPFHTALHSLFQFYSTGLLVVGVLIFVYFAIVVIAETAVSGTPFGHRFQHVWVPIRLVVALGLLMPLGVSTPYYGLNPAQYIVLYAAKYGSGFATNAWLTFNEVLTTGAAGTAVFTAGVAANPSGEHRMIAIPRPPDIAPAVQFMSLVQACRYAYWKFGNTDATDPLVPAADKVVRPYFVKNVYPWMADTNPWLEVTGSTTYSDGLEFYNDGDIIIRFGEQDNGRDEFGKYTGHVMPWCGEIRLKTSDLLNKNSGATLGGPDMIQEFYFVMIREMWFATSAENRDLMLFSDRFIELGDHDIETAGKPAGTPPWQCHPIMQDTTPPLPSKLPLPAPPEDCKAVPPDSHAMQHLIDMYQANLNAQITFAWETYNANEADVTMGAALRDRGWAGAGIWYNMIAQLNGSFIDSVLSIPTPMSYPYIMQKVREQNRKENTEIASLEVFNPNLAKSQAMDVKGQHSMTIAPLLSDLYKYWNKDGSNQAEMDKTTTGAAFFDIINIYFGTNGMFSMHGQNAAIHPMAQLAALGKGLVNNAVMSITASSVAGGLAPIAKVMELNGFAAGLQVTAGIMNGVAFVGLTAGIVLFYVLPFLPFLYFYFAVGTWVMGIFEAMVGAPLWALAHLRIDGEGLPGDSAKDGYFLIFEIFLRPILSVFGLVAAILIFTAQCRVLNVIWDMVVDNLTGGEGPITLVGVIEAPHNVVDQFFFTILYIIIVYMMAVASFKLIDRIPDNILRYMGAGVSTFSDINADPTEGLIKYAAYGGMTIGQQASGAVSKASGQMGGIVADIMKPP